MTDDGPAAPSMESRATDVPGPSLLEARYRRLLRLLPRAYRAAREEEMVATFLAAEYDADPDNFDLTQRHGRPSTAEIGSVIALALRLRWANTSGPERYRVRFHALRIALFGYLTMTALTSLVGLVARGTFAAWPPPDAAVQPGILVSPPPTGVWLTLVMWAFTMWIPALAFALRGGRSAMTWAAALAGIPTMVAVVGVVTQPSVSAGLSASAGLMVSAAVDVLVVAGLVAVAAGKSSLAVPRWRGWLTAAAITALCLVGIQIAWSLAAHLGWTGWDAAGPPTWLLWAGSAVVDDMGYWCFATVAAGLAFAWRSRRRRTAATVGLATTSLLGLTIFAAAVCAIRAASGAIWLSSGFATGLVAPTPEQDAVYVGAAVGVLVQLVAVATVAVVSTVLTLRRFRRLPPVSYAPGNPG